MGAHTLYDMMVSLHMQNLIFVFPHKDESYLWPIYNVAF